MTADAVAKLKREARERRSSGENSYPVTYSQGFDDAVAALSGELERLAQIEERARHWGNAEPEMIAFILHGEEPTND